eukprot:g13637.t1
MSYVMKRCSLEGSFLGALPVSLPSSGKESAFQRRVCLKDYFLHDVYACLGGSYLRYIKLKADSSLTRSSLEIASQVLASKWS